MRAVRDLRLVPGVRDDLRPQFGVGDDDHFIRLQAAGAGGEADCLQDAFDLLLRDGAGSVHLLGGVTPFQFVDQVGHVLTRFSMRNVDGIDSVDGTVSKQCFEQLAGNKF